MALRRRIGAALQGFSESMQKELAAQKDRAQRERELDFLENWRNAQTAQLEATSDLQSDLLRRLGIELDNLDGTASSTSPTTLMQRTAPVAPVSQEGFSPPSPARSMVQGRTDLFPGVELETEMLRRLPQAPPRAVPQTVDGSASASPHFSTEVVAPVLQELPRKFDPVDQRWGLLSQMGNVVGVDFDPTAWRGPLTEDPAYTTEVDARKALVQAVIDEAVNPTLYEGQVIGPTGLPGRLVGSRGQLFGRGQDATLLATQASDTVRSLLGDGILTTPGATTGMPPIGGPPIGGPPTETDSGQLRVPSTGAAQTTFGGADATVFREMSAPDQRMMQDMVPVYQTLNRIEELATRLNKEAGIDATIGGFENWLGAQANLNPDAAELLSLREAYAAQFSKLGGEGSSRLSDQDVNRALSGIPNLFMSEDRTQALLRFARNMLDQKRQALIHGLPTWMMEQGPSTYRPSGLEPQERQLDNLFDPDLPNG
jgi:hypothetical protein